MENTHYEISEKTHEEPNRYDIIDVTNNHKTGSTLPKIDQYQMIVPEHTTQDDNVMPQHLEQTSQKTAPKLHMVDRPNQEVMLECTNSDNDTTPALKQSSHNTTFQNQSSGIKTDQSSETMTDHSSETMTEGQHNHIVPKQFDNIGTLANNGSAYGSPTTTTHEAATKLNDTQKPISDTQKPISDLVLQARLFDERYDMKTRCDTCQQCKKCSPFITIHVKERENMDRNEENIQIRKFMRIVNTLNDKKKFITKMPCEQEVLDVALKGTNRKDVIAANDKKLRQLTTDQQKELWEEFLKLVNMGFIKEVSKLSEEVRNKLSEATATYYIAVAPAFKSTSTSTKTRCAFDASMQNRTTKKSLNDYLPIGYMGISLTSTFRNFRTHPIGLACDLKKYYNSIEVHEDSFPVNRIVFRDNANPSGELKEYVLQNLFYGIRPAGSITDEALKFIAREAVIKCKDCGHTNAQNSNMQQSNDSIEILTNDEGYSDAGIPIEVQLIDEDNLNPSCKTVNHEVYRLLQSKYVDDILHSTYTYERVDEIKKFTEKKLTDYSFATKGWNVTGDMRTPGHNNLNDDNKLGTCSYLWDPHTDRFKPKEVLLHNGERFRGAIKPMKNWVQTTQFGRYFTVDAPILKTKIFKDISEITVEALEELWRSTPKTLRSGLSKTYMLFEPCGFLAPIAGQTRAALHEIVKLNGNNIETEVPEQQWNHLLRCMVEQLKAMTYEYERRPDKDDIDNTCKSFLYTFVDYGANICVVS